MAPQERTSLPTRSTEVAPALPEAGVKGRGHELTEPTRTAAEPLGWDVGADFGSLVFISDEEPVPVLTSGRPAVDTTAFAARWGRGKRRQAVPEQARTVSLTTAVASLRLTGGLRLPVGP